MFEIAKIAVFETSDIFTIHRINSDFRDCPWAQDEKYTLPNGDTVFSLGRLEKAIDDGYTCYVASTRTRAELSPHDEWWIGLVGRENVFLAEDHRDPDDHVGSASRAISAGWMKVYEKFGLEWPKEEFDGRLAFWTSARAQLPKLGVRLGHEFETEAEIAHKEEMRRRVRSMKRTTHVAR
jgi:hypothetical protein